MTTVKQVKFDCPCCGARFKSTTCPSTNSLGPTTTDFFDMAAGEQSIHHRVHTCTRCGFSFEEVEPGDLSDGVKRFVAQVITPRLPKSDIPSWTKFEFLALIDESVGSDPYSLGMTYLHAAWCCYDMKRTEGEAHFRRLALEYMTEAWQTGKLDPDLVYLVPYLIAEQYRRIGDEEFAEEWYTRIMGMEEDHPDRDLFVSLAVQQSTDPREFMGDIIHPP